MEIIIFQELANLFSQNGYHLYMIGGTSRDYLLKREVFDYDFVTDATPQEIAEFLPNIDMTFANFGTVKYKNNGIHIDIVTFREEGDYKDARHPQKICLVREMEKDYIRRDFTINAIYIDAELNAYDFCSGINDLQKKIIKMIDEPYKRIKEDPLRIIRALRFKLMLGFQFDELLEKAIINVKQELERLNSAKISEEIRKMKDIPQQVIYEEFAKYGIEKFLK